MRDCVLQRGGNGPHLPTPARSTAQKPSTHPSVPAGTNLFYADFPISIAYWSRRGVVVRTECDVLKAMRTMVGSINAAMAKLALAPFPWATNLSQPRSAEQPREGGAGCWCTRSRLYFGSFQQVCVPICVLNGHVGFAVCLGRLAADAKCRLQSH